MNEGCDHEICLEPEEHLIPAHPDAMESVPTPPRAPLSWDAGP